MYTCTDCGITFEGKENIVADYTDRKGTMLDGCILLGCPECGEEVETYGVFDN